MENLIPTLYGWVVILCQLLALFAIVIGIAKGFVIYCQNIFTVSRAAIAFDAVATTGHRPATRCIAFQFGRLAMGYSFSLD